jgi:membrane-associated protease RseP (regulator of RpoE activity)
VQELLYFLLVVSIVVTVHELGHFWAARAVGVRVRGVLHRDGDRACWAT